MTDASKAGRVIFIGMSSDRMVDSANWRRKHPIWYFSTPFTLNATDSSGLTEEQIVHTFGTVGQVLNFRLVYDQDTGRPKGFGFAEFADRDSAESAVRNLNGYEIMGRELRVDFSHVGGKESEQHMQAPIPQQPPNGQPTSTALPPLPPGVDLPPNLSCPDAISKTLSTLSPPQLLDILSQMKGLVMGDPARATELLTQAPHLSYAIFQALLLMGLVDTSVLASVVETQGNQAPPQPPPPPQRPPHRNQPPPPQYSQFQHPQPTPMNVPTPPQYGQPYQPPQMQNQPPPPSQNTQQEELIKQVLAMTQQQIDSLPPAERAQIMTLRQSLGRY